MTWPISAIIFARTQNAWIMKLGEKGTSLPVHGTAKTKLYCFVAGHAITGFQRIMAQYLCILTIANKRSSVLFWPSPKVTAFGGQREFYPLIKMPLTELYSRLVSIAKRSLEI
jgi:hypothetical protein